MHTQKQSIEQLKNIPKVDFLLSHELFRDCNKSLLKNLISKNLQDLRTKIMQNALSPSQIQNTLASLPQTIKTHYDTLTSATLRPVVNASGVVIQTNLGRSVFAQKIIEEITPILTRYNTLEYDLQKGSRSSRYTHTNTLLQALFGAQEFLLVNNNASAVFLILQTFAKDMEVIISRGELVEIGGEFRIPEVMKSAGCILREVGSTNKTHLHDYIESINPKSALIMKAHQSNFTQIGFVKAVDIKEINALCKEKGLIDYYDLGSGYVQDLLNGEKPIAKGIKEPSLKEIFQNPPSLLSFSGDKLFGGPQVGIIAGKKELVDKLKANHLLRALRVDKLTLSVLQATLQAYLHNDYANIPTLHMLSLQPSELKEHAQEFLTTLQSNINNTFSFTLLPLDSLSGGGSLPNIRFESFGIGIRHKIICTMDLESRLRQEFSIITRIEKDYVICDMRTLLDGDKELIINALQNISQNPEDS